MGQSGCCAPECITNSRKYTGPKPLVFCCSKDSREQWIRAIKTKWEGPKGPPQTIIICERHFKPELIVRTQTGPDGIGNIVTYPIKPKLVPGALPTIFPELSAALQSDAPNPRDSREERERKRQRQHAVQADMDLKTREKADILDSFQSLETEVHNRLFMWQRRPNAGAFDNLWKVDIAPGRVVLYQMDYTTDRPRVRRSVEFVSCLTPTVIVFDEKQRLDCPLDKWSALMDLVERAGSVTWEEATSDDLVYWKICGLLEEKENVLTADINSDKPVEVIADLEEERNAVRLFGMQFKLRCVPNQGRRFTPELMAIAQDFNARSTVGYKYAKSNLGLILPSRSTLNSTTSNFRCQVGLDVNRVNLLEEETKHLSGYQRIMSIQMDEIHNETKMEFKSGKLTGAAVNDGKMGTLATTTLVFYVVGIFSNIKMPIAIYPVQGAGGEFVKEKLIEVIKALERIRLEVLIVLCDNHAMNRKTYRLLIESCGCSKDDEFFIPADKNPFCELNPLSPGPRPLFLDFNFVHVMKSIRNNWIRPAARGALLYLVKEGDVWVENTASWVILRLAHELEANSLLRCMPGITGAVINPGSYARQNVSLALRSFSDSTSEGLTALCEANPGHFPGWQSTVRFQRLVYRWWKCSNVQYQGQGFRNNDPDQQPLRSVNDCRMTFMQELLEMLVERMTRSVQLNSVGKKALKGSSHCCLTDETFSSFIWNVKTKLAIIPYLLHDRKVPYVLTGKFTTSNLEGFFGWIRQMCGAKFAVSVLEILEATKKTLIISYLKNYSVANGPLFWTTKKADMEVLRRTDSRGPLVDFFRNMIQETEFEEPSHLDMENLIFVAGYAVFKLLSKTDNCESCARQFSTADRLQINTAACSYTLLPKLDRGRLTYPSPDTVSIANIVWKIVSVLTLEEFHEAFLHTDNQREVVERLAFEMFSAELRELADSECESCSKSPEMPVKRIIRTCSNTLLKNFGKRRTEQHVADKQSDVVLAKRKRAARKNQESSVATN